MRKILIAVLLALNSMGAATSFADSTAINTLMGVGLPAAVATQLDTYYSSAVRASEVPATDNAVDLGSASKEFRNVYVGTSVILGSGANLLRSVYAPVAIATPVTGTNLCPPGVLCAIPTVAANAAVYIGAATPVAGTEFFIKNTNATNAVRAKAAGGATINGAVAGGYISLVAGTSMHCLYYTVGDATCDTYTTAGGTTAALPTPAGP